MRFPLSTANAGMGGDRGPNPPTAIYRPILSPVRGPSILGSRVGGQASSLLQKVVRQSARRYGSGSLRETALPRPVPATRAQTGQVLGETHGSSD